MSVYLCVKHGTVTDRIAAKTVSPRAPYLRLWHTHSSNPGMIPPPVYVVLDSTKTGPGLKIKIGTNTYMPVGSYTTTTTEAGYSGTVSYTSSDYDDEHISATFSGVYYSTVTNTISATRSSRYTSSLRHVMAYGKLDVAWNFDDVSEYLTYYRFEATTATARNTYSSSSTTNANPSLNITSKVWKKTTYTYYSSVLIVSTNMFINMQDKASSRYYYSVGRATTSRSVYQSITASTTGATTTHYSIPNGVFMYLELRTASKRTVWRSYRFKFNMISESYSTTHESLLENTQQLTVSYVATCTDTKFSTEMIIGSTTISDIPMYGRVTDAYTETKTITVE